MEKIAGHLEARYWLLASMILNMKLRVQANFKEYIQASLHIVLLQDLDMEWGAGTYIPVWENGPSKEPFE